MLEKIEGRRRRGQASEDEVAGWHHRRNEHEFGQTSGDCEGQGGLACCSPWGHKESDTTGRLNTTTTFKEGKTCLVNGRLELAICLKQGSGTCV